MRDFASVVVFFVCSTPQHGRIRIFDRCGSPHNFRVGCARSLPHLCHNDGASLWDMCVNRLAAAAHVPTIVVRHPFRKARTRDACLRCRVLLSEAFFSSFQPAGALR